MILCTDLEGALGNKGDLLYHFPKDLANFKEVTLGSDVVMGRNTWESLPFKLPNRRNIVMTSSLYLRGKTYLPNEKTPDAFFLDFDQLLRYSQDTDFWIIGGSRMYEEGFKYADEVHHTVVHDVYGECDTRLESIETLIAENFRHIECTRITDIDKKSGLKKELEFRIYKK